MTTQVRHRPVVIHDVIYQVPTNVCWDDPRQHWIVSIRVDKKSKQKFFLPEHHDNNIRTALDAASVYADQHRTPRAKRKPTESRRKIRDFRPLPKGIYAVEIGRQLKLVAMDMLFKHVGTAWVGVTLTFTRADYFVALEKVVAMKKKRDAELVAAAQAKADAAIVLEGQKVKPAELEKVRQKLTHYDQTKRDHSGKFAKAA